MGHEDKPSAARASPKIRVGFFPWWNDNPYQGLLAEELDKAGFEVVESPRLSVRKLLRGEDGLDVIHVHWPHGLYVPRPWRFPFVLARLWLYNRLKDNLVWTVHELDFYETKFKLPDRLMRQLLLSKCHALFVHAKSSKEELERRFGVKNKTVLTYHPSYAGHYPDVVSREEARRRLGVPEGSRLFLYFGKVKPYKGVEDLIRAFGKLPGDDNVLFVVGLPLDRRIKRSVETMAARDVRIRTDLRYISADEVQVFFNAADIVVFPFRRTHTSGSIMLALTFGKPVIAPAIASIPEYVNDSMAVLFDPEDAKGLSGALERALTRNLTTMAEAAREQAARFTWHAMADKHREVYEEICGVGHDNTEPRVSH